MEDVEHSPTGTDLSSPRQRVCGRTEADQAGSGGRLPEGLRGVGTAVPATDLDGHRLFRLGMLCKI